MSSTRLLVLGAVRIFQPAHGYFIRRELLSWGVESWAHVNPGSVYNALRSLTNDGLLSQHDVANRQRDRTFYRLTPDGENAYFTLLRDALWEPDEYDQSTLLAGLCFATTLKRAEVIDAMAVRADALRGKLKASDHRVAQLSAERTAPAATTELLELAAARLRGELEWCEAYAERVRQGRYVFYPEPGWNTGPDSSGHWPGPTDRGPFN
jgi:DNA-binding PadR family transcriptional regulator